MSALLDSVADLLRDQLFTGLERVEGPALVARTETDTVVVLDLAPEPVLRCLVVVDPGPAAQSPDLLMAAMLEVTEVPLARLSFHTEQDERGDRYLVGEVSADLFAGEPVSAGALAAAVQAVLRAASLAADVLAAADAFAPAPETVQPPGPADLGGLGVPPPEPA